MPEYRAIFRKVEGLDEEDLGNHYRLNAITREEAEEEALALPRPEGANFIVLLRDGFRYGALVGLPFND